MQIPKILFLDLDNTIYNYETAHNAGQKCLIEFLSVHLGHQKKDIELGLSKSKQSVKERLGHTGSSHSRLLYLSEFFRAEINAFKPDLIISAEQIYWQTFFKNMLIDRFLIDFLTFLRLNNCKVILVTDLTLLIQLKKIIYLNLDSYIDVLVSSEEMGSDKGGYEAQSFLNSFDLYEDDEVWCIGDKEEDYLFPGKSLFFLKINNGPVLETYPKHYKFSSFHDLLLMIDSR